MSEEKLTIEQKRAIPRQFHTNLNNRDFDKQLDLVTEDVEFHKNGDIIKGSNNFINALQSIMDVFADAVITDHEIYADGNVAVVRYVLSGTLTGQLTFPNGSTAHATGKPFQYSSVEFFEFNDEGKVIQIRQVNDSGLTPLTVEAQVK
ncbi:nuclear transport factor 2 family protein [Listeria rocourtiae]|uniref:nuclear transport factor 2 family protein n=1 Tax=Listeria rocourtiae TaxID=647910 RepID=UPI003D2F6688